MDNINRNIIDTLNNLLKEGKINAVILTAHKEICSYLYKLLMLKLKVNQIPINPIDSAIREKIVSRQIGSKIYFIENLSKAIGISGLEGPSLKDAKNVIVMTNKILSALEEWENKMWKEGENIDRME